jgi:hypothetical protein
MKGMQADFSQSGFPFAAPQMAPHNGVLQWETFGNKLHLHPAFQGKPALCQRHKARAH